MTALRPQGARFMAKLEGRIAIAGLPPHRGLNVSLCFFPVESAEAPIPFGGDPPAEAVTDCHQVVEQVGLETESTQPVYQLPFAIERPAGYYYVQVRAMLFRTQEGKVFAQVENFFFGKRPLQLTEAPLGKISLPVS